MKIFDDTTIAKRRQRLSLALAPYLATDDLVLFYCGQPISKPGGLDQTYPFLPHPLYFWLTGLRRQGGVTTYSRETGWTDFILPLSKDERIWEGGHQGPAGRSVTELEDWLQKNKFSRSLSLGQVPTPNTTALPVAFSDDLQLDLQECVNSVRRVKDAAEIRLVQQTAQMAHKGYQKIKSVLRPGLSEREIQIAYETEVLLAGSEKFPYDTIVGAGTNAAILHAVPTSRIIQPGDLILVDAGADLHDYCVDITRVFSAEQKFNSRQQQIYDLVLQTQMNVIQHCQVGHEWHDVHRIAARTVAEGLRDLGLLTCSVDTALETGAVAMFFPHGVGHMVGLKVRDVGADPRKPARHCCGVRVRVDFALQSGFVMTAEPGIYFIPALLDDPVKRQQHHDHIGWSEVEKWRDFGGVRIEDDILITDQGPQNLTALIEK